MSRPQALIFFVVAFLVLLVIVWLREPWNDVASSALMLGVFSFALIQERRTGRSSGVIKWVALGLAAFYAYQVISFLTSQP